MSNLEARVDGLLSASVVVRRGTFELTADLSLPPGMTVLLGRSGAGKSTLLAALAGLLRPERGRVTLGAQTWFDAEAGVDVPVHQRGVAFVFQSLALFPHQNARENVEYGIDRAVAAAERRRRALATLARFQVAHLAERRPATYSGGEAQRVALARAFARSPRLVLLDEAFSALDRDLRRALCADVKEAVTDLGVPALMVTHHQREARRMTERAIGLEGGQVRAEGTPDQVIAALWPSPAGNADADADADAQQDEDEDDDLEDRRSGAHPRRRRGATS